MLSETKRYNRRTFYTNDTRFSKWNRARTHRGDNSGLRRSAGI